MSCTVLVAARCRTSQRQTHGGNGWTDTEMSTTARNSGTSPLSAGHLGFSSGGRGGGGSSPFPFYAARLEAAVAADRTLIVSTAQAREAGSASSSSPALGRRRPGAQVRRESTPSPLLQGTRGLVHLGVGASARRSEGSAGGGWRRRGGGRACLAAQRGLQPSLRPREPRGPKGRLA